MSSASTTDRLITGSTVTGYLVACYATLHPAMSVRQLVGRLVGRLVGWLVGRSVTLELKTIANVRKVDFIILGSDIGLMQC